MLVNKFQRSEYFEKFQLLMEKGYTSPALTFNIYDDNIREATITLFRLLQEQNTDISPKFNKWLKHHINVDMFQFAKRLFLLYTNRNTEIIPPFIENPKYFTNAETIIKANRLRSMKGHLGDDDEKVNQIYRKNDLVTINTNYSGWNLMNNGFESELNYFREDIALNSFYYGINLLHPFWMHNEELDNLNIRHTEHFFYVHQQLLARYLLEKVQFKVGNVSQKEEEKYTRYDPFLRYDNGLAFPVRYEYFNLNKLNKAWSQIISSHISLSECISRGLIVMVSFVLIFQ